MPLVTGNAPMIETFQIPSSYQIYTDQFETQPELAIDRLKARIEKRNPGAVGYLLLSWLYLRNGQKEEALNSALTAKILAPGSQFLSRLPYFIQHPKAFEAWQPVTLYPGANKSSPLSEESHPIKDLDLLISRLSSIESTRLDMDAETSVSMQDLSDKSAQVDDIVTETLAVIHEKQGNLNQAIQTYEKLILEKPDKVESFKVRIEKLKKLQQEKQNPKE